MENYNKDIFESIRKTYEIARESERKRRGCGQHDAQYQRIGI